MANSIVRIKPLNKRDVHVMCITSSAFTFTRARGWYKVTEDVATACEKERMNDMDPTSPYVFDVSTPDDANEVMRGETRSAVGTADSPNELAAASTAATTVLNAPAEEKGQARVGKRRDS